MCFLLISVCVSVCPCVSHTGELRKTAEPIEMLFAGLTQVDPKNRVLDGSRSDESILRHKT